MNDSIVENDNECPWLLFKLHGAIYAVNSRLVASIVRLTDDITIIPDKDDYIKGIITFREKAIKIIDMRTLLSVETMEKQYDDFKNMLDQRKQDHVNWVNELERCVDSGEKFTLTTDPHQCAFGKWYDGFHSDINSINFHMKKIDEPHQQLHKMALEVMTCEQKHEECERKECLKLSMEKTKDELMPQILELIDEAKDLFNSHFKEMIIVFESDESYFGISVDEVLSVDELEFLNGANETSAVFKTKYVYGVGKTKKSDELVLLLNQEKLAHITD